MCVWSSLMFISLAISLSLILSFPCRFPMYIHFISIQLIWISMTIRSCRVAAELVIHQLSPLMAFSKALQQSAFCAVVCREHHFILLGIIMGKMCLKHVATLIAKKQRLLFCQWQHVLLNIFMWLNTLNCAPWTLWSVIIIQQTQTTTRDKRTPVENNAVFSSCFGLT